MTSILRCEECPAATDDAVGWIALIVDDEEEPEPECSVAYYCPVCAEKEFKFQRRSR